MHTLQIKALIRFLTSPTYFEHHVFVIRKRFVHAVFYGMFFMHLCKQSRRWTGVFDNFCVQTVFLMMNPLLSKHTEDVKNRIKALIWKASFRWIMLHINTYCIVVFNYFESRKTFIGHKTLSNSFRNIFFPVIFRKSPWRCVQESE